MSVGSAPSSGSTGTTLSAQSVPMLVRKWQMRVPSSRGTHQGPTCHIISLKQMEGKLGHKVTPICLVRTAAQSGWWQSAGMKQVGHLLRPEKGIAAGTRSSCPILQLQMDADWDGYQDNHSQSCMALIRPSELIMYRQGWHSMEGAAMRAIER